MKTRDKLFLMVVGAAAILVLAWMVVVSPERKQAATLGSQVTQAQAQLATAQSGMAAAREAQAQYPAAYASVVSLGKAVPAGDEVASLVYQLAQASNTKSVDFSSITTGAGATGTAPAATGAPGSAVGAAGFQALPFTFHFTGSFFALYHLLNRLNGFTLQTANGNVQVSGRLLTIDGVSFDASGAAGPSATGSAGTGGLSGTVTATAYMLPQPQGLTAGATPGAPAGAPAAQPASGAGTSGAATPAPAVVRATP
jgi:hypothetical protein